MTRASIRILLALLILGAYTHCVESHAREAVRIHLAKTLPVSPDGGSCENESSCICKGATLASPVELPDDCWMVRPLVGGDDAFVGIDQWRETGGPALLQWQTCRMARTGPTAGMLCALLQRFLI